jgi:3-phosphoshikimate 1-carboxyvinyltransferase
VRGFLHGDDCVATWRALSQMGVSIEELEEGLIRIEGAGARGLTKPPEALDLGNSGTGMRLLAGLLSAQPFDSELTGDASLRQRPMERIARPLAAMGAQVSTSDGTPPLRIRGGARLHGCSHVLAVASAQVKSALLLAGIHADGETEVVEPAVTRDHTERMLRAFGCQIDTDERRIRVTGPQQLEATDIDVPGDFSSAAFFLVAGCLGAVDTLLIEGVGVNPTRTGLLEILRAMGADIELRNRRVFGDEPVADLAVRAAPLKGVRVPEALVSLSIDEFPALFVAAACASGETVVSGAHELRHKESDRLGVMAAGLERLGVVVELRPDGMTVHGGEFGGGEIDSHGDHRIAMAFTMAALRAGGPITVRDTSNVATSFPGFVTLARQAGLDIAPVGP